MVLARATHAFHWELGWAETFLVASLTPGASAGVAGTAGPGGATLALLMASFHLVVLYDFHYMLAASQGG